MTLKVRRIISLIFIVLFLLIAPVIILYAAGYKISKRGLSLERTGLFIIASEPPGAKILINGQTQKAWLGNLFKKDNYIATPAKIKNFLPGEYELSLELNGYYAWKKKLTINPGSATAINNVYLFKKNLPVQIVQSEIKETSFSPNKNQSLIIAPNGFIAANFNNDSLKTVSRNNLKENNINWSPRGDKLIIDNILYGTNDFDSGMDLSQWADGRADYQWQDNNLYFQGKNAVYRFTGDDPPKKIADNLIFEKFLIKNDNLFLISQKADGAVLEIFNDSPSAIYSLPGSAAEYSFINQEHALINIYDHKRKILYLFNPLGARYSPLVETVGNLNAASWINENSLFYFNDFEIWLADFKGNKKTLITRVSDKINNAYLHPNNNYVIYSTDRAIKAIELDDREKRGVTELIKLNFIKSFALNTDGSAIYFAGRLGNGEGLYKLLIH